MESPFFRFSNLSEFPEIVHGISTRTYGNMSLLRDNHTKTVQNRQHFANELGIKLNQVVVADMVHGAKVVNVGQSEQGRGSVDHSSAIKDSDGLITGAADIYLMITAADCLSLLIYDPENRIVAAVHLGWRSIVGGIIARLAEKLHLGGSHLGNLVVGLGPGICQKHFVVKNDVLGQFMRTYPSAVLVRNKDGYVDLRKAATGHLLKAGFSQNNLEISSYCPVCHNGIFGSHRLEKENAPVSAAIIGRKQ